MFFADIHSKSLLMDDLITKKSRMHKNFNNLNVFNERLANLLYLYSYIPVAVTTYLSSTCWFSG